VRPGGHRQDRPGRNYLARPRRRPTGPPQPGNRPDAHDPAGEKVKRPQARRGAGRRTRRPAVSRADFLNIFTWFGSVMFYQRHSVPLLMSCATGLLISAAGAAAGEPSIKKIEEPVLKSVTYKVMHSLKVKDIPAGAKNVRIWFW